MSKINIGVSDKGQLNIGNLAQGQEVHIITSNMNEARDRASLVAELSNAVRESVGGNEILLKSVESRVTELSEALSNKPTDEGKIGKILKLIKEHHSWAFPAIAAVVKRLFPTLVALL